MSDLEQQLRDVRGEFPTPDEAHVRDVEQRVRALAPRVRVRSRRPRTLSAVLAALIIGVLAGYAATRAAGTDATPVDHDLTIAARQYVQGVTPLADFSGHIPSRNSGELVELLERDCGDRFDRIVTSTQSGRGGLWVKEQVFVGGSKYWTARWNGRYSERLLLRAPLWPRYERRGRRVFEVTVHTKVQNVAGRPIVLQRRTGLGAWVRIRQARLRAEGFQYGAKAFSAVFTVRQRGLTLRIVVPEATARPCYDAAVTPPFRS